MTTLGNPTAAYFNRSLDQMANLRGSIERLQTQVATGQRIERASDDPTGAARLRALDRLDRLGAVEQDNAAKLAQDLTFAADQMGGVANLIIRTRELALSAASDTLPDEAKAAIAEELEQLGEELFDRANGTTLTGEPLFAGTAAGPAFTRDAAGNVTYAGNNEIGAVTVARGTEIERGVAGNDVFEFPVSGTPTSTFALINGLADALRGASADPTAAAQAALEGLDIALESTTRNQAVLGTRLAWVEVIQQNQADEKISIAEQRSDVGDTDIASAIAQLQQTLTALEASQASFARVSSLSLFRAL
ncbi:flagellin N-terminal helical domain-containing protein [Erythrobacter crassostreae]|uniref:Flagellar biosynthesis protein FlgL n=1 Tax=Erythrobacter crassostreae TaxID=2828328 RepID=A0A9X1F409_9SPHN|nr:flagellar biosynthesis protein FlgL [Erythrobacter crassostrea]MBV7258918.1 flagellar biosynthesis protein FlgL [Erythrobacter crassostrea]